MSKEKSWLLQQVENAQQETENWPEWRKESITSSTYNYSDSYEEHEKSNKSGETNHVVKMC